MKNKYIKCLLIEYYIDEDDNFSSEIFDNIEKAFEFTKTKGKDIINIIIVEVNKDNLYHEANGSLNYEDNINLFNLK